MTYKRPGLNKEQKDKLRNNIILIVIFTLIVMAPIVYIDIIVPATPVHSLQSLPSGIYQIGLNEGQIKEVVAYNETIITTPSGQAVFSPFTASLYENGLVIPVILNASTGKSISLVGNSNKLHLLLNPNWNTTIEITGSNNNLTLSSGKINLIITGSLNEVHTVNSILLSNTISGTKNMLFNQST